MEFTITWPVLAGMAVVVFSSGSIVEKIRNGKYMRKDMCSERQEHNDERWKEIKIDIDEIKKDVKKLLMR